MSYKPNLEIEESSLHLKSIIINTSLWTNLKFIKD